MPSLTYNWLAELGIGGRTVVRMELPEEIYALAEEAGIVRSDLELAAKVVDGTPRLPLSFFCIDGQEAGEATLRIGREYDDTLNQAGYPEMCLVLLNAEGVGHKLAFYVDRAELAKQLGDV